MPPAQTKAGANVGGAEATAKRTSVRLRALELLERARVDVACGNAGCDVAVEAIERLGLRVDCTRLELVERASACNGAIGAIWDHERSSRVVAAEARQLVGVVERTR